MFRDMYKGDQLMAVLESWSRIALKKKEVTEKEAMELAKRCCEVIGVPMVAKPKKGKK